MTTGEFVVRARLQMDYILATSMCRTVSITDSSGYEETLQRTLRLYRFTRVQHRPIFT